MYKTITNTASRSRANAHRSLLGMGSIGSHGARIWSPTKSPNNKHITEHPTELSKYRAHVENDVLPKLGRDTIYYQQTEVLIEQTAQNIVGSDSPYAVALANHMIDNTCHFDCDRMCCVTKIMNRYKIPSSMLLMQMYNDICNNANRNIDMMYITDAERYLYSNKTIDLSNGMVVSFRKNQSEIQIIDINQYDGVVGSGEFYKSFLKLMLRYVHFSGEQSIKKKETQERIQSVCRSVVGCSDHDTLYRQFVDSTTHMLNDTVIDLTKLMDLHAIESYELFHAMVIASRKCNMGNIVQKYDSFDLNTAKRVLKERDNYIDIYDGIPIKNTFRKSSGDLSDDMLTENLNDKYSDEYKRGYGQSTGDGQYIDIKRFDVRTDYNCFYKCILNLLNKKINDKLSMPRNVGSHNPSNKPKSDIMIPDKPKSDIMVLDNQNTECRNLS
jgi:hypothetical protein